MHALSSIGGHAAGRGTLGTRYARGARAHSSIEAMWSAAAAGPFGSGRVEQREQRARPRLRAKFHRQECQHRLMLRDDGLGDEIELAKKRAGLHVAIDTLQSLPSSTFLNLGGGADAGSCILAWPPMPATMRRDAQRVQLQGMDGLLEELLELDKADGEKRREAAHRRYQRANELADPPMAGSEITELIGRNGVFVTVGLSSPKTGGLALRARAHSDGHTAGRHGAPLPADHMHFACPTSNMQIQCSAWEQRMQTTNTNN